MALWKRNKILEQVAFANIWLAAASTIVAAFFGIRDNIVFYNGSASNHIAKIALAITLIIITIITAIARWRNNDLFYTSPKKALYVAAYFVSLAIAALLGLLGGMIVFGF